MKKVLSFKTETSGLPNWGARSNDESQPHLVKIAAVLLNSETKEVIESINIVVIPDGWSIPEVTIASHGITEEYACKYGIPENQAVEAFLDLVRKSDSIVSSNKAFNKRIIRIALARHAEEFHQEAWKDNENHFCAVKMAKDDLCSKSIKFDEALLHYTGNVMECNDSLANAKAAANVYFAINNK